METVSKPTVEEMNEVIAEFMELEKDINTWRHPYGATVYLIDGYWHPVNKLKYHSDWKLLMPVVEKIENLTVKGVAEVHERNQNVEWSFAVEIKDKQCMIHRYVSPQYYGQETDFLQNYNCRNTDKIAAVHRAVYDFITWYNLQP